MGGLGLGSYFLGPRADARRRPLRFYGQLELGIAAAAAASPLLLALVHQLYVAVGGSSRLGGIGGALARLVLAAAVIGLPTFLMGGTLPALARSVEQESDRGRRKLAVVYGANTLGAVAGTLLATFVLLEALGIRSTIWLTAALNLAVALAALAWSRRLAPVGALAAEAGRRPPRTSPAPAVAAAAGAAARAPVPFLLVAAALVGFAFLLMELVWYRMLAPLLGGSSYTLGLILAVALCGIGAGGLLYAAGSQQRRPSLTVLATSLALEAALLVLPLALGDGVAVLTLLLRPLGNLGLPWLVTVWTVSTALVVLPPALVAGYQFPLLVGLLGEGREGVGREVGWAYAANTLGAILGSLAGGFGLLPLLGAPNAWRAVAVVLLLLAAATLVVGRRGEPRRAMLPPAVAGLACLGLLALPGPSAFWRHTPIGAGRLQSNFDGLNELRDTMNGRRRSIVWEADGVESNVAVKRSDQYELLINGKSDGSALRDAPTQVMGVLVGALLHPDPKRALVIGLGTGSSAGWLASVPSIERVDVVEIEAAVVEAAGAFDAVNQRALANPKVELIIADGREFLLTTPRTYDLIFSEPSNPYRAGISSLFTREFYAATAARLEPGGVFLQWLQGYEVDADVVRTAYGTLGAVFPSVESWQIARSDLLLAAWRDPPAYAVDVLRARVAQEPYRSALAWVWGVGGLEGFFAGYVAAPAFASEMRSAAGDRLNTDDHPLIEFGFARNLGRPSRFDLNLLRRLAVARQQSTPPGLDGALDWQRVAELAAARNTRWGIAPAVLRAGDGAFESRVRARLAYSQGNLPAALALWSAQPAGPLCPFDLYLVAESKAEAGSPDAAAYAEQLRAYGPVEAEAVLARWRSRQDPAAAAAHLESAFLACRRHPWAYPPIVQRAFVLAHTLTQQQPALGRRLYASLAEPFAAAFEEDLRLRYRLELAGVLDFDGLCQEALRPFEPHVPWEERFLTVRDLCYSRRGNARAPVARRELEEFQRHAAPKLEQGLPPAPTPPGPAAP
jgi:spermidine synthase